MRLQVFNKIWTREPSELRAAAEGIMNDIEKQVVELLKASVDVDIAREQAELARRPLDQKKFLDMLVDDLEEKYIELLEGTRAHTANIDNYIKRLTS